MLDVSRPVIPRKATLQRFHIVKANEDPYAATQEDLERLSVALDMSLSGLLEGL